MDVSFPDNPDLEREIAEDFAKVHESHRAMNFEDYRKIPTVLDFGCLVSEDHMRGLLSRSIAALERVHLHWKDTLPPVEDWEADQVEEYSPDILMEYEVESCSFQRVAEGWAFVFLNEIKSDLAPPVERYMRSKLEVMGVPYEDDFRPFGESEEYRLWP